jgi:NitT/TauT family transport system ATP-binding protein
MPASGSLSPCESPQTPGLPPSEVMSQAVVGLHEVAHRFGGGAGRAALAHLNLVVAPGEFLTLLGPSGCGKSTVLRLAAGLLQASSGQVWRQPGLRTGFVFQEPTLMPWASVFDNVWLPLRLAGRSAAEARAAVMQGLEWVGLADVAQARPRELSGGMRMRVSIARALVIRPQLLLLDEPFAALDEITRNRLDEDLVRIHRDQGLTVMFVTHSVAEAVFLSTRIAVFSPSPGRVVASLPMHAPTRDDGFRSSVAFLQGCSEASTVLRRAMPA